jgi:hypothetical protein
VGWSSRSWLGLVGTGLCRRVPELPSTFGAQSRDRLIRRPGRAWQCERAFIGEEAADRAAQGTEVVRRAQRAGLVDPAWDPIELLRLILSLATYWASASGPPSELSRYRDTVEEAVRRLVAPPR